MSAPMPLARPGIFLVRFALATGVLLPLWSCVSHGYLAGLVWLANRGLALTGLPPVLRPPDPAALGIVYPGVVAAVALFLATPSRTPRWRLRWTLTAFSLMAAVQATGLYLEARLALTRSLAGSSAGPAAPPALEQLAGMGEVWSGYLLVVPLWFWAAGVARARPGTLPD